MINISNILQDLYLGYVLADTGTILTIQLKKDGAKDFYNALKVVLQPKELSTAVVYEFTDVSNAIIAKGTRENISRLKEYFDQLQNTIKTANTQIVNAVVKESLKKYCRAWVTENWDDFKDYNIHSCMKCGYVMMWAKGRFPLQQPLTCQICGSYMFQKTRA